MRIRVDIFIVFSFRVPRLQGAVLSFSYCYASCGVECGGIENERLPHGVALVYSLFVVTNLPVLVTCVPFEAYEHPAHRPPWHRS